MTATCHVCGADSELAYRCSECEADLVGDGKDGSEDRRGGQA